MRSEASSGRVRWGRFALVGSIAVHGGLALWLALRPPAPPLPPIPAAASNQAAVEISIGEPPVAPAASPAEERPTQPATPPVAERSAPPATPSVAERPATPSRPRAPRAAPPAPTAATNEPPPGTAAPPPGGPAATNERPPAGPSPSDVAEGEGLLRMRGGPDLVPDGTTLDRYARDGVIAPPPAGGPPSQGRGRERGRKSLIAGAEAMLREEAGRKNIADGRVHPQYYDLLRDAGRRFKPPESVVASDPRSAPTAGNSVRGWVRGFWKTYLSELERQGKAEAESGKEEQKREPTDVLHNYNRLARAADKGFVPLACQVCVVFEPDAPPRVVVARSSGNQALDKLAEEAMNRALRDRTLEHDALPGRGDPERVCYRFTASLRRMPPLPMAGCAFEETTLQFGCVYPLKKMFDTDVVLDSIQYRGG